MARALSACARLHTPRHEPYTNVDTPLMVQRMAHHLTRTLTRYHWLRTNNTNTAAIVHHATRGINSAPCAIMTASRNNKALAGAGIVALGAGAFLCARAYSRARVADSSKKPLPSSVRVGEAVVSAALPRETQARAKTPEAQTTSTSGPCEGCDCGMMEPGPLEGTMHAYERHVIICRFVLHDVIFCICWDSISIARTG